MSIESTIVSDVAGAAGSVATSYLKVIEYAIMLAIVILAGYLGWHFAGVVYQNKIDAMELAAQEIHQKQQDKINALAADFEAYRTAHAADLPTAQGVLANDVAKNPAYHACHISPSVLRAYNKIAR